MYTVHLFTEIEQDEPITGESIEEVLSGYDLTERKIDNIFELAGGDIAIVEEEPEEEPYGYQYKLVSKTANYANIAARILESFGEGMVNRAFVFDAAQIALALRNNSLYVFPLCNPFIDLLLTAVKKGDTGLHIEEVTQWITDFVCKREYALYDDASIMDVRASGFTAPDIYTFFIEKFGQDVKNGPNRLAAEIVKCVR